MTNHKIMVRSCRFGTAARAGVLTAAVVLAAAACGSSAKKAATAAAPATSSTTASSAAPSTSAPSNAGAGASSDLKAALAKVTAAAPSSFTLSLAKGPQGIFVIGPNGHTLYYRTTDQGTTSSCTGTCATSWPALSAANPSGGPAIDESKVATANGQVADQVSYFGHLLYYFSGDTAPGQTNGVGKPNWFLLGPVGNQMTPVSPG